MVDEGDKVVPAIRRAAEQVTDQKLPSEIHIPFSTELEFVNLWDSSNWQCAMA